MTNYCLYFTGCKVPEKPICTENFEKCIIYQRIRNLDKHKPKTGLEKFIERYGKNHQQMFIGSRK